MGIQVLDQGTINKIAAGEVIERPASIVKELIENAIDAKATAITVEIKDGGISFVRITDNGCGIDSKELPLAFLRHSTSKIKSVEDLVTVSSLGFRGEALSSIAAVAQVELITKTKESFSGSRFVIEGGKQVSIEEIGAPDGTTFIVRNLFYNVAVRRKFLKSATTEAGYIDSIIEHLALSHPDISFRFINNNQNKLHTSGNTNLKDIIYHVYGREISANLLNVTGKTQDIAIEGFIGKPVISRGNRSYENYYINGRYIKSNVISRAIEEAYKGFIMMHKYPFTAIHFTINPEIIDVNVHPTKMELRFSKNDFVYEFVMNSIRAALTNRELIPNVRFDNIAEVGRSNRIDLDNTNKPLINAKDSIDNKTSIHTTESIIKIPLDNQVSDISNRNSKERLPEPFEIKRNVEFLKEDNRAFEYAKTAEQMQLFPEERLLDKQNKNRHKIIGQLFDTYWMIEFEDKLFIMDQHAAHEKILFEKTMKMLSEKKMYSQMLNPPIIISLSMREEQILNQHIKIFTDLGYEIEEFGGKEYKVIGIPASLPTIDNKNLLIEILDSLVDENLSRNPELLLEKVASMSCKAAVKGNNTLSSLEAKTLIDELLEAENPYNCPHGRPTLIAMTKYELEKKFKRIV